MALKAKLDKLDGLPADVQKEYREVEEGGKKTYVLDIDGAFLHEQDPGPLLRAKDHEKEQRKQAEKRLGELNSELEKLREDHEAALKNVIPKDNLERLESSYKGKITKLTNDFSAREGKLLGKIRQVLADDVASEIAHKISTVPKAMLPIVRGRIAVEETDGDFVTRILDREGKPSALSIDDLQKELRDDPELKGIIIGSKASGGGASGGSGRSGAPRVNGNLPQDLNQMTPSQLVEYQKRKRDQGG